MPGEISVYFRGMPSKRLSRWSHLDYVFFLVLLLVCRPGKVRHTCDHYTSFQGLSSCLLTNMPQYYPALDFIEQR